MIDTLASFLNTSADKCVELPAPPEPKFSLPGFCLAKSISSCSVLNFELAGTIRITGVCAIVVTGTRSLL